MSTYTEEFAIDLSKEIRDGTMFIGVGIHRNQKQNSRHPSVLNFLEGKRVQESHTKKGGELVFFHRFCVTSTEYFHSNVQILYPISSIIHSILNIFRHFGSSLLRNFPDPND